MRYLLFVTVLWAFSFNLIGEYLAGLIIVLMLTGGEALEEMAAGRAGRRA